MSQALARHARIVILAWIVLALVAAPLFAKLHTVVKVQQYSLPEDSEARKAEQLLARITGGKPPSNAVVIVQGVDLRDNETLLRLAEWGREYNETLVERGIAHRVIGLPVILAEANESIYRSMLSNITMLSGQAVRLYNLTARLDEAYAAALENMTSSLEKLNQTAYALAALDAAYANLTARLAKAASAAQNLSAALAALDTAYANLTRAIERTAEALNQTAGLLQALDRVYAELAAQNPGANKTVLALEAARMVTGGLRDPRAAALAQQLAQMLPLLDPEANGTLAANHTLAVMTAAEVLKTRGEAAAHPEIVDAAVNVVLGASTPGREAARIIAEQKPEARQLIGLVEKLDPAAAGALAGNRTLLAEAVAEILSSKGVPRDTAEKLARLVVVEGLSPREAAKRLALELIAEKAREEAGGEAEKALGLLQRLDPGAEGRIAEPRAALAALINATGAPFTPEQVEQLLSNETLLRQTVAQLVAEKALEAIEKGNSTIPRGEAEELVKAVAARLAEEGPLGSSDKRWSVVEELLADAMRRHGLPDAVAARMAGIAVNVARGEARAEDVAARMAEELLLSRVAPELLEKTRGVLVSRDLDGFIVMADLTGASQDERANQTRLAASLAAETLRSRGFEAKVYGTGPDLVMTEVREYARHDAEKTSRISEAATFVVLLLILESLLAVLLPYIGVIMGLLLGGALVYLGARAGVISLDTTAQSLMITTALGLGADYAAYIVHRFREEVAKGLGSVDAAAEALARAGPAVLASALTVMIGFGSLLLGWEMSFLRGLGETIPVTVAATALAGLTLVPALLAVLGGRRAFWWPRGPRREHVERESRVMRILHRHHRPVLAAIIIVMLVAGYYYVNFKGSHDMKLMLPSNADAVKAFNLLSKKYMPGLTDPVYVVLELPKPVGGGGEEIVKQLRDRIASIEGVGLVIDPLNASMPGMRLLSGDGRVAALQVVLSVDPYSGRGEEAVQEIHSVAHEAAEAAGATVYVGGSPYAVLEMDELLHSIYYRRILPAAAALMILVFTVIFGSLPASIAAFAVIVGAAMTGIMLSVVLFKGLLGEDVPWFLHIVSMMAVLGVGMDYNSFFLARAAEECRRIKCEDTEEALASAVGKVGLFIIGLAVVVSSAYLSMLAASNTGMKAMGFTLGVTILLAGAMAGYLFTPLVIALLGRKAWWPKGLEKKTSH